MFMVSLVIVLPFAFMPSAFSAEPIIIDHTCTDISQIPEYWLEQAKQLTIHYAHTSHGGQINFGILNLESLYPEYSVAIRTSATAGLPPEEAPPALRMYDGNPPETYINPDDYWDGESGKDRTRAVADTGDYDFSMWSWCGQVSGASESYIQNYIDTLNQFENEYPGMKFIYMTGHLDGTGSTGNLHVRNEQIRNYCIANNKVLFDFADIERFDPDGADYLDLGADDECNYNGGNWADEWCAANPGSDLCASCSCAHSKPLNCNLKGRAFWWMMARLAGWPGPDESSQIILLVPDDLAVLPGSPPATFAWEAGSIYNFKIRQP
jgi:hypothetical protein